jgi:O-antigen ligase
MNMRWNPAQFSFSRSESRTSQWSLWLTGLVLTTALFLGGASRENPWPVAIIEIVSLPLLAVALINVSKAKVWGKMVLPSLILVLLLAIPLVQLIPIPFDVWKDLPGRQLAAQALSLAGLAGSSRPLSLTPAETQGNLLALIPPIAVFLGVAGLSAPMRKRLTLLVPAVAIISLAIGAAQVAGGDYSPLYFYETTNAGAAVGLFSNRNHHAALLIATLPLVALWIDLRGRDPRRRLIPAAIALAVLMMVILGLVIVKSRAGVLLLIPSLFASLALVWRGEAGAHRQTLVAIGLVVVASLFIASIFALGPILERFGGEAEIDGRMRTAPIVIDAALAHMPLGSGIGSFVPVFAAREPVETMAPTFWNHAHNDYLEIWLEAGVMAAVTFALYLAWWTKSAFLAWRAPLSTTANLARVGTIVTLLLLIHSTVDYPLRTLAIASLFAFACGLMVLGEPEQLQRVRIRRRIELSPNAEQPQLSAAHPI